MLTDIAARFESFADGRAPVDAIDEVLATLAAFAGMWNESTVRGPAWRFGDIGVRLERALVVLAVTGALVEASATPPADGSETTDIAALEVLLASNESLVAYRRQHRSDVALGPALELLLRDRDNPRGYVTCMERVAEHVADVGWYDGTASVSRLVGRVTEASTDDLASSEYLTMVAAAVHAFADEIVDRWFATPVKPMLMQAGRAALRS